MIGTAIQLDEKTRNKIDFPDLDTDLELDEPEVRTGVTVSDLIYAASNGFAMIVRYVLMSGVNPNQKDELGRTAMMVASTREILDLLQEAGGFRN